MKKIWVALIIFWVATPLLAQQEEAIPFVKINKDVSEQLAATITASDLRKHLTILASDEFEGRETGTEGNRKAQEYIANYFKSLDLPTIGDNHTYFQNVTFTWTMWDEVNMEVNGEKYRQLWEFLSFPNRNRNAPTTIETDEIIFLGYGIDDPKYSDYRGKDLRGKVIMIDKGEPMNRKGKFCITGTTTPSEWTSSWEKKLMVAKKHGVKAVLFIEGFLQKEISQNRRFLVGAKMTLGKQADPGTLYANSCSISSNIAKAIMGKKIKKIEKARKKIRRRGKSRSVALPVHFKMTQNKNIRTLKGNNIMAFFEGIDPKLKDEVVVVTAHYDHLGKRGDDVYNGADDNGSGTSTVLEVIQAFSKAKKEGLGPRRSVLCMLVTGEEKGLLGSKFYSENPVFPLENTVADINVDMVGRVDEKYKDHPNYIYVIGSDRLSTELHEINETANKKYTHLTLDYTYNADDDPD